ncbi:hypothetical protein [Desulfuromonas sp. AOP6]|uniref:hypothetical protein n=1 Tax=Desulfuromonas sp. AOP6 TaxID=1566351 RepID=UPI00127FC099|nr:hypothetical protein [Desulfuromonas sp. AOP6]BCA80508.1 hypothetical protein AOP6_2295 [Desulfuromonas sp. AOP6]
MIKNIGESPLEKFQADAKRLAQLDQKERQSKATPKEGMQPTRPDSDRVTLGQAPIEGVGYTDSIRAKDLSTNFMLLRDLIARTLEDQGIATRIAVEGGEINLKTLSPEEAQSLIAEDGYFGVEKTSDRVVQFAIGLAGNDPARLEAIRQGVEDGFTEAEKAWGGKLPEISYQTRDAIMEKLDDWVVGFSQH